ncbi:MAG: 30S ribosomal protein S19 [Theionarchaea archaeon]|nr:MAG: 30S ribosomal protein S19 [Theionarchaea archaeon DG-70-1]MBU7026851.1 30S ribosomal protein S19 [Theionarchaea archaeon]
MAKKEFMYRGTGMEDLQKMPMDKFISLLPSRQRKTLKKGLPPEKRKLLVRLRKAKGALQKGENVIVKTHCRDMVVLPEMVGLTVGIYNGREFNIVELASEMVGHFLGEFALTRRRVKHSAPGIGATKSSMYVPLK